MKTVPEPSGQIQVQLPVAASTWPYGVQVIRPHLLSGDGSIRTASGGEPAQSMRGAPARGAAAGAITVSTRRISQDKRLAMIPTLLPRQRPYKVDETGLTL